MSDAVRSTQFTLSLNPLPPDQLHRIFLIVPSKYHTAKVCKDTTCA